MIRNSRRQTIRKFKITQEQAAILKTCASIESAPYLKEQSLVLEPGIRHSIVDHTMDSSMNIALVTKDGSWDDTDLEDYGTWTEFRKGVELTENGRGDFDFYIRRRGDRGGELHGNVTMFVENGEISRIVGYGRNPLRWSKENGFA